MTIIHSSFAERIIKVIETDRSVIGLAVGGSWITNEMDEFSDLDLVLVTKEKISGDKTRMLSYANSFGKLLNGFTGEHVGEPRLLICLYDDPLLHVDIKFLTLEEFHNRVETPLILFDTGDQLKKAIEASKAVFPYPGYQWIEDRFWVWVHYIAVKIRRGEFFEAFDSFSILRSLIFGPLLHIRNNKLPRGVRKVETQLESKDMEQLKKTLPSYDAVSLMQALQNSILLYRELRVSLFPADIVQQRTTEEAVLKFLSETGPAGQQHK